MSRTASLEFTQIRLGEMLQTLRGWVGEGRVDDAWASLHAYDVAADDPGFREWLISLYPDSPVLDRGGERYLVAVYPACDRQQRVELRGTENSLDGSLLDPLEQAPEPRRLVENEQYRSLMEEISGSGGDAYNGAKFAMRYGQVAADGAIRLSCEKSDYFSGIATCDALKLEAQKAWIDSGGTLPPGRAGLEHLPYRKRVHELVDNPLLDAAHRSASVAISTLIVYRDGDRPRGILMRRSARKLAVDRSRLHVVPSAMFEPSRLSSSTPFSVVENILREVAEECYDEPEHGGTTTDETWYRKRESIVSLLERLDRGVDRLYFTGLAVNLLNLRPELCTVLYLGEDPDESSHEVVADMTFNWEFLKPSEAQGSGIGQIGERPFLDRDDIAIAAEGHLFAADLVPPGAAALWLGADLVRGVQTDEQHVSATTSTAHTGSEAVESGPSKSKPPAVSVLRRTRKSQAVEHCVHTVTRARKQASRVAYLIRIDELQADPERRLLVCGKPPESYTAGLLKLLWLAATHSAAAHFDAAAYREMYGLSDCMKDRERRYRSRDLNEFWKLVDTHSPIKVDPKSILFYDTKWKLFRVNLKLFTFYWIGPYAENAADHAAGSLLLPSDNEFADPSRSS